MLSTQRSHGYRQRFEWKFILRRFQEICLGDRVSKPRTEKKLMFGKWKQIIVMGHRRSTHKGTLGDHMKSASVLFHLQSKEAGLFIHQLHSSLAEGCSGRQAGVTVGGSWLEQKLWVLKMRAEHRWILPLPKATLSLNFYPWSHSSPNTCHTHSNRQSF